MPPRVSLCMIVRNEEANLPACLGSVAGLVHEAVVVDTGSTDRTREVARGLGARVFEFAWTDDFAAARNEGLRHVTGDWVFWLDGDERLDAENRLRLQGLFVGLPDENVGYLMKQRSAHDPTTGEAVLFDQLRLFRNHPLIRWEYRVHEQIQPAVERLGGAVRATDVVIDHAGYLDPALYRRKLERNLRLLRRQEAERPDDPFTLFNLGWTYQHLQSPAEAMRYLRRSLDRAPAGASFVRKAYALLARGHHGQGQRREALAACGAGRALFPDDVELLFLEGLVRSELGDHAGAEQCLVRLLQGPTDATAVSADPGMRGYKARHNLARVYRALRRPAEAEAQWRAALAERPDCVPAWVELGELYLEQGRWAEADQVVQRLQPLGPLGRLATALLQAQWHLARGEAARARSTLEEACRFAPRALEPRALLGRLLLRERDPAAAQVWRDVLALQPGHAEAQSALDSLRGQPGRGDAGATPAPLEDVVRRAEQEFQAGHLDEAAALYRQVMHVPQFAGAARWRLGQIANTQGDYAAAWGLHRQAVELDRALPARITPADRPHHQLVLRAEYATEEVLRCPVCDGTRQEPMMVVNCLTFGHYHPSLHPVRRWVRCLECGHGFANPRPTTEALRLAYQDPPPPHLVSWSYEKLTVWSDIVHDLWSRRPGGDFLDVGAANGALAGVAMDYGYRACGLDIHPAYADQLRRLGVEFLLGDVADFDFGGRRFDVVTLGDVIEHVADPRRVMARVVAVLKPGGVVWLSTPNYTGVWTRSLRERDAMWQEGEHLHFFCLDSLKRLLSDQGLAVVDYRLSKRFVGCAEVIAEAKHEAQ